MSIEERIEQHQKMIALNDDVQRAIDNCDVETAARLLREEAEYIKEYGISEC